MNAIHYIGLDVHKKTISYCIKTAAGQIVKEGTIQAAQRLATDRADRSGQAGATLESAASSAACPAINARTCQSRHLAGGAQTGRLSASSRQERPAFSSTYTAAKNHPNKEKSQKTSCLGGLVAGSCLFWVCSVSDPPAGPHVCRDCARELTLPIHPIVCLRSAGLLSLNLRGRSFTVPWISHICPPEKADHFCRRLADKRRLNRLHARVLSIDCCHA
jgi:hypothetical protein